MHYLETRKSETQFLALTSLYGAEFDTLLAHFAPLWQHYYRYHTLEGRYRRIPTYQEHGNAKLRGDAQKLFFLLVYLKSNSLQHHQAASFGICQGKVCCIAKVLLIILNQCLIKLQLSPIRDGQSLRTALDGHFNHVFTYDGIERGIQRNSDQHAQEQEFSGKKKPSPEKQFVV